MAARFEIKDTEHPTWRGQRFSSEKRARQELTHAVGTAGRWVLVDRTTGATLATSRENI